MKRRKQSTRPPKRFSKKMQKKLLVIFSIITLLLIGLIIRLMYINQTSGQRYEKIVLSQQGYDSTTIPYQRGNITDSRGTILATSVDVYNVILDCKVLNSDKKNVEPTIAALMECFADDIEEGTIRELLAKNADGQYNVLAKRLPYEKIHQFVELQNDEENNPNINGVWFEKEYIRKYPYDTLASAVVGFTTSGNLGMNGVEYSYNTELNGVNGREYGYLNADSNFEKTVKPAVNGNNIVLTIDANIQTIVEKKIADFLNEYDNQVEERAGAKHIGVVVMDPNNAEVLAMANYPNYNLSDPWDLSAYYTEEEIGAMEKEEKLDVLNRLWMNFCTTYTYEPGSTVKPFTVAAGLETGTLNDNMTFECDGVEVIATHDIHCVNRAGHGTETMQKAIMDSCNDALMQMSYKIGPANFAKYQKIFGFGYKTNIDLPGEARTDNLIYQEEDLTTLNLATNSFGQNFNTTMIQVASAFCSIVNGGRYYQPHVVKRITDENGNVLSEDRGTLLKETISEETSELLKRYLYETVSEEGTGKYAKVPGYSMGGKTGTAQKHPRGQGNYLVSFIGYAPQEHPQLVIYVVVDEPNAQEQANSGFAQEIVKEILTEIFPYLNIYQDEEVLPQDDETGEGAQDGAGEGDGTGEGAQDGAGEGDGTGEGAQDGAGEGDGTGEGAQDGAGEGTGAGNGDGGEAGPEGTTDVPDQLPAAGGDDQTMPIDAPVENPDEN